jgi:hypothetical protein
MSMTGSSDHHPSIATSRRRAGRGAVGPAAAVTRIGALPAHVRDRQECEEREIDERQKDPRFQDDGEIVPEPLGGAHRGRTTSIERVGDALERHLPELPTLSGADLRLRRREKHLRMGQAEAA